MLWKILIVAAFFGILKVLLAELFTGLQPILSAILSLFMGGLLLGIVLAGIMIIGEFLCICDSIYIFGYHPFKLGFFIGTGLTILALLGDLLKR